MDFSFPVLCAGCNAANTGDSTYCKNCGRRMSNKARPNSYMRALYRARPKDKSKAKPKAVKRKAPVKKKTKGKKK